MIQNVSYKVIKQLTICSSITSASGRGLLIKALSMIKIYSDMEDKDRDIKKKQEE